MVSWITSRGTSRKAGSKRAEQRHRPFGEPGIFGEQAFVLDQGQAAHRRPPGAPSAMIRRALGRVEDDVAGAELLGIIVGAADGDRAGMVEAVADRGRARFDAGDLEIDRSRSPSKATMPCSGRTQRRLSVETEASPQRIDLGQGKARTIAGIASARTSDGGAAGPVDGGEPDAVALTRAGPG